MGVAPHETLPDELERPRHDGRALDGDGDGEGHVGTAQVVGRAHRDARAPGHVHGVVDDVPPPIRHVLLHDRREDHGRLVVVHNSIH